MGSVEINLQYLSMYIFLISYYVLSPAKLPSLCPHLFRIAMSVSVSMLGVRFVFHFPIALLFFGELLVPLCHAPFYLLLTIFYYFLAIKRKWIMRVDKDAKHHFPVCIAKKACLTIPHGIRQTKAANPKNSKKKQTNQSTTTYWTIAVA